MLATDIRGDEVLEFAKETRVFEARKMLVDARQLTAKDSAH